jgi:hypothetical protein
MNRARLPRESRTGERDEEDEHGAVTTGRDPAGEFVTVTGGTRGVFSTLPKWERIFGDPLAIAAR